MEDGPAAATVAEGTGAGDGGADSDVQCVEDDSDMRGTVPDLAEKPEENEGDEM